MMFVKGEKVFSLARTAAAVPVTQIKELWEEYICYLLLSGLYLEGVGEKAVVFQMLPIDDRQFLLNEGSYHPQLGRMISQGLRDRHLALLKHRDLTASEREFLVIARDLFIPRGVWVNHLTGMDFISIAVRRQFSEPMMAVAHYAAVAFGQKDFPAPKMLPGLYLSVFGNIHLAVHPDDQFEVQTPFLIYGTAGDGVSFVTALSALLSSIALGFTESYSPGSAFCQNLSGFSFLAHPYNQVDSIPLPRAAVAASLGKLFDVPSYHPVGCLQLAYRQFLYGDIQAKSVSRSAVLDILFNAMMEKMGISSLDHLFPQASLYRNMHNRTLRDMTQTRPMTLRIALEALEAEADSPKQNDDAEDGEEEAPDSVDQEASSDTDDVPVPDADDADHPSDDQDNDPSVSPPAVPQGGSTMDKDNIGLISFDTSNEGVDEDLYRAAVVALNDKFQSDDTSPISAAVKDALNQWVNGYLYVAAISATQEQMVELGLQKYLSSVFKQRMKSDGE